MKLENMFEVAVRNKLRFSYKGQLSVEDLFDLPVEALDTIFKDLNRQTKQAKEESLLDKKSDADTILDVKIEIVKYIVGVKLAESEARQQAKSLKEKKQKILTIMAEKQDADLQNKSLDELKAMLDDLN